MRAKRSSKKKVAREKDWAAAARQFEAPGTDALEGGTVLTEEETAEMLQAAQGKRKLISVRMPEKSLAALKEIASQHDRKYQQLIVQAVEQFISKAQKIGTPRRRKVGL